MKKLLFVVSLITSSCLIRAQEIRSVKITDVEKIIAESNKPLIVNMWATWCKPCIEEIPYFLEEVRKINKNGEDTIDILLVNMDFKEDYPKKVQSFVKKRKYNVPIVWLNETNADYFCPKIDEKWQGGLPASLFINNKTGYRKFFEEKVKHDDLKSELKKLLNK